jgi:hypothetical protein
MSAKNESFDEEDGLVDGYNGPTPPEGQRRAPIAWHLQNSQNAPEMTPVDHKSEGLEKSRSQEDGEHFTTTKAPSPPKEPADPNVPWYLQVQRPSQQLDESHPLAHRQRIPELPPNSPPILPEILQRISVDLGLDDLNLLDLRHLDPPPALGSKLIMIVGSARSEKHLHVSADRFARWLRTTHKLKPHAAGLLGRNELKLKLRRKARRMRLLANVGGQEMDDKNIDDGIRTGWVCVTVGRVQAAEAEEPELPREGFIGFGRRTDGVNIVVQMFTEEKRQETDLEGLWERILRRANRDKENDVDQEVEHEFASLTPPPSGIVDALSETETRSSLPRVSNSQSAQQVRRLHTVGITPHSSLSGFPIIGTNLRSTSYGVVRRSQYTNTNAELQADPTDGRPDDLKRLQDLLTNLYRLTIPAAHKALGTGFTDHSSTEFLHNFFGIIHKDLGRQLYHYEEWMKMYLHAIEIEAPGYDSSHVHSFLTEAALSGITPSRYMYMNVIEIQLREIRVRSLHGLQSDLQLKRCYDLLEEMAALGFNPLTREMMRLFHENFTVPVPTASVATTLAKQRDDLREFIAIHELQPEDPEEYMTLLEKYAMARDWSGFWDIWNGVARLAIPRSSGLYATALRCVAESGDREVARYALRAMVPDMPHERPPVECADMVAKLIYDCLLVAEPRVGEEQVSGVVDGEWVRLRDMCQKVLRK